MLVSSTEYSMNNEQLGSGNGPSVNEAEQVIASIVNDGRRKTNGNSVLRAGAASHVVLSSGKWPCFSARLSPRHFFWACARQAQGHGRTWEGLREIGAWRRLNGAQRWSIAAWSREHGARDATRPMWRRLNNKWPRQTQ